MMATNGGQSRIATLLISHGADVNVKDKQNKTALMYATDRGRSAAPLVELLTSKGAAKYLC